MHYDQYLAAGWPIASGVIEGACRHLVKDRCELSGMRFTPVGVNEDRIAFPGRRRKR